jgi:DNA-binding transcriptional LysR family regulator
MDRFLCIEAFAKVAETRSFAEAARQLGVTPSVVTSRIQQLESFAQAPLFHRSTRKVTLSEAGSNFIEECMDILVRLDSVTDRMRLTHSTPAGTLRVQVLPGFALGHLGRALKDFSTEYPRVDLEIVVSDEPVNPVGQGYDVSLQLFRPGAETLIERRLFPVRRLFCAAPAYLKRNGTPSEPGELAQHRLAIYSAYPTRNRWTFLHGPEETTIDLQAKIKSNSVHVLRDFARTAGGITCLPTLVCADDLLAGTLVPILTTFKIPDLELLAIYPVTQRGAMKVKLFVNFIASRFSGEPEWDASLRKRGMLAPEHVPNLAPIDALLGRASV